MKLRQLSNEKNALSGAASLTVTRKLEQAVGIIKPQIIYL